MPLIVQSKPVVSLCHHQSGELLVVERYIHSSMEVMCVQLYVCIMCEIIMYMLELKEIALPKRYSHLANEHQCKYRRKNNINENVITTHLQVQAYASEML